MITAGLGIVASTGCSLAVDSRSDHKVVIGRISGHFGIKGWVRIQSYTRPAEQIFEYPEILISVIVANESWKSFTVEEAKRQGNKLVCKLSGLQSREDAEHFLGCEIAVTRSQLGCLPDGEYYWMDLIGCDVISVQGIELGRLASIMETGANDVFVVESALDTGKELLIPWVGQVVVGVDLVNRLITVDWQEDYLE